MIDTLLASLPLSIILTTAIVIVVFTIFFFERSFIKKREDTLKRWALVLLFLSSFLVFVGGVISIMLIWDFDIASFFTILWHDFLLVLTTSIPALVGTTIVVFLWMLILRIAKISLKRIGDKPGLMQKRRKTITKVTYSIINYAIAIMSLIIILAIWGVNVIPALAGLGIVGLVIGLGAQKFIQDLIAGFFIIFEHHFDVGDVIEVSGFKGTVTDIGLKTTKIRNWKGDIRIYNNGELNTLINYSKNPSVAVVEFGIAYQEDIDKTIAVITEALPQFKAKYSEIIIEDPVVVGVIALSPSSVDLRVTAKTQNEQHYGIERELRKFIKQTLDTNHIEIPFPQVVVNTPKKNQ